MIMANFVAGKALLVIRRVAADHFWVDSHIQSLTHSSNCRDAAMDWATEELGLMEWPSLRPAHSCTRRMAIGDTMRVAVTFRVEGWTNADGEGDSELHIEKARCLRHQHG
jgi:hypothetical protein